MTKRKQQKSATLVKFGLLLYIIVIVIVIVKVRVIINIYIFPFCVKNFYWEHITHNVQSFSPNEKITPELAHKIGEELAECVAPGFQVIVATHVDRDHIHNHFLINSVSFETGSKWLGNQATLKNMRAESDRLCRQYGLSVIDETTGLRGIDQATQKLAEQGKSWKVELCHALDEAKILCHSKEAFVNFMKCKGFEVTRYTDRHITFQKVGEQKKIRADTLAKQFGDYYTKENLERMMGYYSLPKPLPPREQPPPQKPFISEFEKYEKVYFKKHPPLAKPDEVAGLQQKIRQSKKSVILSSEGTLYADASPSQETTA